MVYLDRTQITDRSLFALAALPTVKYVGVRHTGVTREAIAAVRQRRPDLHIPR
jgi:hypothetical protein